MSIQPVDSSVKCQQALQINCCLEVKIWTTGTSEQQPAMWFQLPPPSMQHICSNVIWQTIMTKSLCSQSNGDHKPFWSFICTDSALLFSLSTHIWAVLWKWEAFFLGTSEFPACIQPPHPDEQPQYAYPRSQRGTGGLCALLHEACLLFTFALISCSLSHHGVGDPRQQGRYLGEQCRVFRISVSTEKAFRSAFSSPDFRHSHWMERKEGYGEAPFSAD